MSDGSAEENDNKVCGANQALPSGVAFPEKNLPAALRRGMTLIEILVAVAIIGILAGIAIPAYSNHVKKARVSTAIADIKGLEVKINAFYADYDHFPQGLGELNMPALRDPWGNPYQYILIAGVDKVKCRKNKSLHPINSDYDLYSMGEDGESALPLTSSKSQDDIIRSDDGLYVGLVKDNTKHI